MGRPKLDDKLIQLQVPVRQSLIDKVGKQELVTYLKDYITIKFNNSCTSEEVSV